MGGREEFVPLTNDASNTPRTGLIADLMPPAVPGGAQQWAGQRGGWCSSDSQQIKIDITVKKKKKKNVSKLVSTCL